MTHESTLTLCTRARAASEKLRLATHAQIDAALQSIAGALVEQTNEILEANKQDVDAGKAANLSSAFLDRLTLDAKRIKGMAEGVDAVQKLPHPLGKVVEERTPPNGLHLKKVRVPLGVIAFIYESRPNVTIDAAVLAVKSGNAIVLRGGKEAIHSNTALVALIQKALEQADLPADAVQLMTDLDYSKVTELIQMRGYIDLVIPRGGQKLIQAVSENARVPVLKHEKGVCHLFVDKDVDTDQAVKIIFDSKMQRPGVCNALETLLVDADVAREFLPIVSKKLMDAGCELRGDEDARKIVPAMNKATEEDWYTEYLDTILSVKVVNSLEEAVAHINTYGSKHTDGILSTNQKAIQKFLSEVDSAAVMANCSLRLHDGFEFGMGAEIGISTDKFHARGPVGLEELTSTKWIAEGNGQIRG